MIRDPQQRAANRRTIFIIAIIVAALMAVPVTLRLLVTPAPELNRTARELLPPEASRTDVITLYAGSTPWRDAVAATLPAYASAIERCYGARPPRGRSYVPVEGVLFDQEDDFRQAWTQIFGRDDRAPGQVAIGRDRFFLYYVGLEGAEGARQITPRQIADVAHCFGSAVMEQYLGERYRYVPIWYRDIGSEMAAVAVMPEIVDEAWRVLLTDAAGSPVSAAEAPDLIPLPADFQAALEEWPVAPRDSALATIIAGVNLDGLRAPDWIALVDSGNDVETTVRAVWGRSWDELFALLRQEAARRATALRSRQ